MPASTGNRRAPAPLRNHRRLPAHQCTRVVNSTPRQHPKLVLGPEALHLLTSAPAGLVCVYSLFLDMDHAHTDPPAWCAAGYLSEVQAIAGPFLVVVPLSTVPNWIKEFRKSVGRGLGAGGLGPQCGAALASRLVGGPGGALARCSPASPGGCSCCLPVETGWAGRQPCERGAGAALLW